MIQFKKLAQFFRLLKMMVATMNSIFSISFDKKKFELFISHRTLQKHIIFSLCFKKNVHLVFMISQRTLQRQFIFSLCLKKNFRLFICHRQR